MKSSRKNKIYNKVYREIYYDVSESLSDATIRETGRFRGSTASSPGRRNTGAADKDSVREGVFSVVSSRSSHGPNPKFYTVGLVDKTKDTISMTCSESESSSISILYNFGSATQSFWLASRICGRKFDILSSTTWLVSVHGICKKTTTARWFYAGHIRLRGCSFSRSQVGPFDGRFVPSTLCFKNS